MSRVVPLMGQGVRENASNKIGKACSVGTHYFVVEWADDIWMSYYDISAIGTLVHLIEPKDDWTDIMVIKL